MVPRRGAVVALIALAPMVASAQGNFHSTPTGGRTALMGGAGVALGTDGAAVFLNPATLMRTDWLLSASIAMVAGEYTTVHRFRAPDESPPLALENTSVSLLGFEVLPATICLFIDGPKLAELERASRLSLCFGTTEHDRFTYVGHGYLSANGRVASAVQSVTRSWQRFVLAPTIATWITRDVAVGASLWSIFTAANGLTSTTAISHGATIAQTQYSTAFDGNAFGLTPVLGLTARAGAYTLALAAQPPDLTIYGESHGSESLSSLSRTTLYAGDGSFQPQAPWRFSAGVARTFAWGTGEIDLSVGVPQDAAVTANTGGTRTTSTPTIIVADPATGALREPPSAVAQLALGLEYFPKPEISLLCGASASVTFNTALGGVLPTRQSRLGVSLGVGSHGPAGDLLAGAEVSYEVGRTLATNPFVDPPRLEPVPTDGLRILFVLSGNTSLEAIERGIHDVVGGKK